MILFLEYAAPVKVGLGIPASGIIQTPHVHVSHYFYTLNTVNFLFD